jgi:uncharacterized protein (UPF0332 family)
MTLAEKDKDALIKYRIDRANETIVEAKEALESNHLNLAVNRIYYACFYSTEALMLTRDFSTKDHGVLKGEFNKVYVHGGIVDKKYFATLNNAFENRRTGDYGDFVKFDKDEVRSSLVKTEEFVTEINKMTLKFINKQETENKQKDNPQYSVNPQTPNPDAPAQDIKNQPKPTIKFRR